MSNRWVGWSVVASLVLASGGRGDEAGAAAALKKLGARVTIDERAPGKPVVAVTFTDVTEAGLQQLKELKSLKTLDLSNTKAPDAALKELRGLRSLQSLNLTATAVTDAGMEDLKDLKKLKTLTLGFTKVTAAGFKELKEALPKCEIR